MHIILFRGKHYGCFGKIIQTAKLRFPDGLELFKALSLIILRL